MIRFAENNDESSIELVRKISFPESEKFFVWYKPIFFKPENTIVYEKNGNIVSFLERIPFEMDNIGRVTYIFSACTHPDFRKEGLMSQLLEFSEKHDRKTGVSASVLVPQKEELFDFYEKNGYLPLVKLYKRKYTLGNPKDNSYSFRNCNEDDIDKLDYVYLENVKETNFIIRTKEYWRSLLSLFNISGGKVFILEQDEKPVGYAFVWNQKALVAQELCCLNSDARKIICHEIMELSEKDEITAYSPVESCEYKKYGCVKLYNKPENDLPFVMNLMLD
ncbi:MAG: GNAT family N-acetyltransferase [Oscillospiraceae bacterium]|jgi:predicted acetyltransferase